MSADPTTPSPVPPVVPAAAVSTDAPPPPPDADPSAASAVRWGINLGLATVAVCVVSFAAFFLTPKASAPAGAPTLKMPDNASLERGLAVYATNCATCHGDRGLGDGPQAEKLAPKPRDFAHNSYKIAGTATGLPADADLEFVIRHGMLPSAMPPWAQLTDGEVRSLVMAVRHLAIEARVAEKLKRDAKMPREKAVEAALAMLGPGPTIVLPPRPAKIDPARGKAFFAANCAACHDPDGRGKLRTDLVDNDDLPIAPRDLTAGQYKGRGTVDDIALRIVRGIPGSPMPPFAQISADDLWATAEFVKSLAVSPAPAKPGSGSASTTDTPIR